MRVLLVDDKGENLYYLSALLSGHGHLVELAHNGAEALQKAQQSPPDVVISDLLMPVMDGYMLLRHWRTDPVLSQRPFIVYTATYTSQRDEQLALRLGADAFIVKPCEPEDLLAHLARVMAATSVSRVSAPLPAADGEVFSQYSDVLVKKLEEKMLQLEVTNRSLEKDIVERRRIEFALRESEGRFRVLAETVPQLVWVCDEKGYLVFVNEKWKAYTGLSGDPRVERDWTAAVHEDDLASTRAKWSISVTSGEDFSAELRLRRSDGTAQWWLVRGLPLRIAPGRASQWFGTCTDIDELKGALLARDEAEQQVAESAAILQALFASVPDGVTHVDLAGRISASNGRTAAHGSSPNEPWIASLLQEHRQVAKNAFDQVLAEQRAISFELAETDAAGTELVTWNTLAPVVRAGRVTGVVAVSRDITERKAAEAQLLVSDRMASLGTLAAGMAHEINNPLASVLANLSLAHPEIEALSATLPIPRDLRDEIRDASEAAERIRVIVRDLKLFSREGGDRVGPVDIEQVLESTLRMASNDLRHRARLVKDYGAVPPVRGNESRLTQVFLNLVMNAAQAIPTGHVERNVIRLKTYVDTDRKQAVVAVSDTGQGMAPEVRKRVFRPFVTTKPAGEGTGLGLSICKRIITELQGTIDFVSELGQGTTFFVRLPLAEASLAPPDSLEALPSPAPRSTILVVDDEEAIGRILRRMLSRDHDVSVVGRAEEALSLIRAGRRFDLILCDLMMPELSGAEFYEELKRIDGDQTERLVFMTGGAFTPATQAFLARVNLRRIEKPFTRDTLQSLVSGLIS